MVWVLMAATRTKAQSAYFFAVFIVSGVYQMGDDQARS
jgi:hypothetical protein